MKKIKMNLAGTKIVEKWRIWITLPCIIVLVALIAFGIYAGVHKSAARGMNIGTDFTGGSIATIYFKDSMSSATYDAYVKDINKIITDNGLSVSYNQQGDAANVGAKSSIVVRYSLAGSDKESSEINDKIKLAIEEKFGDKLYTGTEAEAVNAVDITFTGATASVDLIWTAVLSVVISTVLILIYIIWRFRNVFTGLAAVIALIHDVIIVLAMTMICYVQINSSFIAAIITIIAYSINNSIVLFDRVRDNYKKVPLGTEINHNYVVNKSIAQTLSRSILTTVTTMAAIVVLAIIGVASIREFALPVIFGLIAGAFSSIFLAPTLYCLMKNAQETAKKNPKQKKARKPKAIKVAEDKNA